MVYGSLYVCARLHQLFLIGRLTRREASLYRLQQRELVVYVDNTHTHTPPAMLAQGRTLDIARDKHCSVPPQWMSVSL